MYRNYRDNYCVRTSFYPVGFLRRKYNTRSEVAPERVARQNIVIRVSLNCRTLIWRSTTFLFIENETFRYSHYYEKRIRKNTNVSAVAIFET